MHYFLLLLFPLKNIDCGYLLEVPHRDGSIEYQQAMFGAAVRKILSIVI